MADTIFAVALSEEVTAKKPLGVDIGEQPIVLWRDAAGIVHALEDRCPHRRAPLSLGCVKPDGNLQCGYHGWTFDGSGKVLEIPQVRGEKKLPAIYRAESFTATERDGFVFVSLRSSATDTPHADGPALPEHGVAHSPIDLGRITEILLDGPHLLLTIPGIRISEYPLSDPERVNGLIRYERGCRADRGFWPDRLTSEFPLSLQIALDPQTGLCDLMLLDAVHQMMVEARLAFTPSRRGTTAIRWRARQDRSGLFRRKRSALMITGSPDGAKLRSLLKDASTIIADTHSTPFAQSA